MNLMIVVKKRCYKKKRKRINMKENKKKKLLRNKILKKMIKIIRISYKSKCLMNINNHKFLYKVKNSKQI